MVTLAVGYTVGIVFRKNKFFGGTQHPLLYAYVIFKSTEVALRKN